MTEHHAADFSLRRALSIPLIAALALTLGSPRADAQQDELITTHAVATFGIADLTYPADLVHLAYVNPEAPKGG